MRNRKMGCSGALVIASKGIHPLGASEMAKSSKSDLCTPSESPINNDETAQVVIPFEQRSKSHHGARMDPARGTGPIGLPLSL